MNIDELQIPEIELTYLNSIFNKNITEQMTKEHEFKFSGSLHLCAYVNTDKTTLEDVIQALVKDVH